MKKVILMALFAGAFVIGARAQDAKTKTEATPVVSGTLTTYGHYIDKDNDGVCDNWTARHTANPVKGSYFKDENKDGVCDNRTTTNRSGYQKGYMRGNRSCHSHGNSNGYGGHRHGWKSKG